MRRHHEGPAGQEFLTNFAPAEHTAQGQTTALQLAQGEFARNLRADKLSDAARDLLAQLSL